jgi:hypothetical protein
VEVFFIVVGSLWAGHYVLTYIRFDATRDLLKIRERELSVLAKSYMGLAARHNRLLTGRSSLEKGRSEGVSCWFILGMMPTKDKSKVEEAFRRMSKVYHPDLGGDSKAFQTLVKAKEKALELCR